MTIIQKGGKNESETLSILSALGFQYNVERNVL